MKKIYFENNQFSERERDVIDSLMQGKSNKQIAQELGISRRTVEFHLSNIYAKLGVISRSEAILKFADSQLWESTGHYQVKPTVDNFRDSKENGLKSISQRINMKKLYYIVGGLLVAILFSTITIAKLHLNIEPTPSTQFNQPIATNINSTTLLSPANIQEITETSAAPLQINQQTSVVIPPHTVNEYTASVESYYVDTSHIIFQVRLTGGDIVFGNEHFYDRIGSPNLYDENGIIMNASVG